MYGLQMHNVVLDFNIGPASIHHYHRLYRSQLNALASSRNKSQSICSNNPDTNNPTGLGVEPRP